MREEDEEEEEEEARLLELEATLISSLSDEMREAYDQLDPEQQIQALEMLRQAADERAMAQSQQQMLMMEQQQLMSRQDQEEMVDLPEEHFLTIALNGEWRQIGGGGRGDTVVFCFVIFFFPFLPSFLPSFLPAFPPSLLPLTENMYLSPSPSSTTHSSSSTLRPKTAGTILGATEMVTGFPPGSLLMTSA
jgi:hypothetical protein